MYKPPDSANEHRPSTELRTHKKDCAQERSAVVLDLTYLSTNS